jgi:hypothetical protein
MLELKESFVENFQWLVKDRKIISKNEMLSFDFFSCRILWKRKIKYFFVK